jgi:predicted transcriptional regulator
MAKEAVFTLKLEPELRDRFIAAAKAVDRPASQLVRELMREFVDRQRSDHDDWFRAEVEQAVREADDPDAKRIAHDDVARAWAVERAALMARPAG